MSYSISYSSQFDWKALASIDFQDRQRIKIAIEEKLSMHPTVFGKPLRQSLRGYWRLRVGDYRVLYKIDGENVRIASIDHRSTVY